jgi:hypothetical protein
MAVATGRVYGLFIDGGTAEPASCKALVVGTGTRPANPYGL